MLTAFWPLDAVARIVWDVHPELVRFGPVAIRYYSLGFLLTFGMGFHIIRWLFRSEAKPEEDLNSLLNYMVVGTIVGARLGHCLFYDPAFYLSHPLEILKVWHGGLASHGGAIGICVALYLYTRSRPGQPYLWLLDRMVVPTALGGFFIRIGNLFNSEILGTPADVPWAIVFKRIDDVPRHPAQLYESLAYGLIFALLLWVYSGRRSRTPSGLLLGLFLIIVFSFRFFVEFLKIRQAAYGHELPISVGQWLSIPAVILGVLLLIRARRSP